MDLSAGITFAALSGLHEAVLAQAKIVLVGAFDFDGTRVAGDEPRGTGHSAENVADRDSWSDA